MSGMEIAQLAKQHLADLTGLKPDTVSAMSKCEDGWHVSIDLVQLRRIPDGADVLATYDTVVDDQGDLVSYERTRCFRRGEVAAES